MHAPIRRPVRLPLMISLSHVSKRYPGGHEALQTSSFTSTAGELAFITGHSGAGKTTLLKLIAAIERPTAGTVIVNGQNVGSSEARARFRSCAAISA